ncbi:MAG: trypsin-like peptidase domain-containing protein, partial [Lutispora sp.]|nr:trypsin-like peptidase domain-containing protein [Lutispora sp.]
MDYEDRDKEIIKDAFIEDMEKIDEMEETEEVLEKVKEIGEEENRTAQKPTFYREVIEKKPKKWGKMGIAIALAIGLAFGSAFGFIADNIMDDMNGKNVVYATEGTKFNYTIDKTVSPVVPIAKKVSPSIVAIKIKKNVRDFFGDSYQSEGTGSGIIIDNNGHIVTNNHVVEGSNDIVVVLKDGKELAAKIVGRDGQTDLAVIKVEEKNLPYVELGDSSTLEVGELAVAIGSPMGTEYAGSVTAGVISGLDRK